jgi:ABC-2 type transport system permease protein
VTKIAKPRVASGVLPSAAINRPKLGGAWVPPFLFPEWLQSVSLALPTRWAVDGLEAMTWRGMGLEAALAPIGAMLGFSVLFGAIAVWRFQWEEAQ